MVHICVGRRSCPTGGPVPANSRHVDAPNSAEGISRRQARYYDSSGMAEVDRHPDKSPPSSPCNEAGAKVHKKKRVPHPMRGDIMSELEHVAAGGQPMPIAGVPQLSPSSAAVVAAPSRHPGLEYVTIAEGLVQ